MSSFRACAPLEWSSKHVECPIPPASPVRRTMAGCDKLNRESCNVGISKLAYHDSRHPEMSEAHNGCTNGLDII